MYRLIELVKLNRKIFHSNDLAIAWGIRNKNTLYTTIKRDVQKGLLFPIYKGLYSIVPPEQLNPLELGKSIPHHYTYLTTETVLAQAGLISQNPTIFTFASEIHKKATIGSSFYLFRKLKSEYLYNPIGLMEQNGILVANTERAAADMLYFNPRYYFDLPEIVDFGKVRDMQNQIGYPHAKSPKRRHPS